MEERRKIPQFEVVVTGIIFNPEKKKVLIGKRAKGHDPNNLDWCFPGGRLVPGEDIDKSLKRNIKRKTGYSVKNVGTFFSRTHPENPRLISVSFLTTVYEGEEMPGDDIMELKWVEMNKIEKYFKIPLHSKLREFLFELV